MYHVYHYKNSKCYCIIVLNISSVLSFTNVYIRVALLCVRSNSTGVHGRMDDTVFPASQDQ